MSGAAIIAELLVEDPVFDTAADQDRLKEDRFPEGVGLPAYLIRTISGADRSRLTAGHFVRSTERVSVTVRAASAEDRRDEIARVRRACADKLGDIAGCFRVAVTTAGLGPSLLGPNDTFEQTLDFSVSFDAQA